MDGSLKGAPVKITYQIHGLDDTGEYVPDPGMPGVMVAAHVLTLPDAFMWAERTLATDTRLATAWVRESIQDQPGTPRRVGAAIAMLERAPEHMTSELAMARVVDTVVRAHLREHGTSLNAETQERYLPAVDGMVSWVDGPRRVRACTPPPPDYPALFASIAGDALDLATAALHGSPYALPDTAMIGQVTGRTWEITW